MMVGRGRVVFSALLLAACTEVEIIPDDDDASSSSSSSAGSGAVTSGATTTTGAGASGGGGEGGSGTGGSGQGGGEGGGPPGQVPGIVAVGYGGLRIVSRDDGLTWSDRVTDGAVDDIGTNLWSVAWGAGRWVVAGGARLLISTDGVMWTDASDTMPYHSCAGVAFFQDEFWLGCAPFREGLVFRSADGVSWDEGISLGEPFTYRVHLLVGGGKLVAHDNSGTTLQTSDGVAWTSVDLTVPSFCAGEWKEAAACGPDVYGSSWHAGTWLAAGWPGRIRRSTDGATYTDVYVDPEGYTVFDSRVFARGYVAP
jgi:hypothetical protein